MDDEIDAVSGSFISTEKGFLNYRIYRTLWQKLDDWLEENAAESLASNYVRKRRRRGLQELFLTTQSLRSTGIHHILFSTGKATVLLMFYWSTECRNMQEARALMPGSLVIAGRALSSGDIAESNSRTSIGRCFWTLIPISSTNTVAPDDLTSALDH